MAVAMLVLVVWCKCARSDTVLHGASKSLVHCFKKNESKLFKGYQSLELEFLNSGTVGRFTHTDKLIVQNCEKILLTMPCSFGDFVNKGQQLV